jgi:hypothetical protein
MLVHTVSKRAKKIAQRILFLTAAASSAGMGPLGKYDSYFTKQYRAQYIQQKKRSRNENAVHNYFFYFNSI